MAKRKRKERPSKRPQKKPPKKAKKPDPDPSSVRKYAAARESLRSKRIAEAEELLGLKVERSRLRKSTWYVRSAWTRDLLLTFDHETLHAYTPDERFVTIRQPDVVEAMERTAGFTVLEARRLRERANEREIKVKRGRDEGDWECWFGEKSEERLLRFRLVESGMFEITEPNAFKSPRIDFDAILELADRRKILSSAGTWISLRDNITGEHIEYAIVVAERPVRDIDIPWHSPLGQQLIYKRAGDDLQVSIPGGSFSFTVVSVSKLAPAS